MPTKEKSSKHFPITARRFGILSKNSSRLGIAASGKPGNVDNSRDFSNIFSYASASAYFSRFFHFALTKSCAIWPYCAYIVVDPNLLL